MAEHASSIVRDFLESAPEGAGRILQLLAGAESLTDNVAQKIYNQDPIEGLSAEMFVQALHYSDFVTPRNSEWHINPVLRDVLQSLDSASSELIQATHNLLIKFGTEGDPALAGSEIPRYLFSDVGRAYHLAAIGQTKESLKLYSQSALGAISGLQWLASSLAEEQERKGIIPQGSIEPMFLRAMVLFHEGKREKARPIFRDISSREEMRLEVGISCHIYGNMLARNREKAERLFRQSINIGKSLGNKHHIAQTQHSLANLISRDRRRYEEAETLFWSAIEILKSIPDIHGLAKTEHSLANLLSRIRQRHEEAESLYLDSIALDEKVGNINGVAQSQHSYARLIMRYPERHDEAETLLRKSLEGSKRANHQAQVLCSLSLVVEHRSPQEAKQLLEHSLDLNISIGNRSGERLVRNRLQSLDRRFNLKTVPEKPEISIG